MFATDPLVPTSTRFLQGIIPIRNQLTQILRHSCVIVGIKKRMRSVVQVPPVDDA